MSMHEALICAQDGRGPSGPLGADLGIAADRGGADVSKTGPRALVVTSATLVVTGALLVVTRSY